ncbi:2-polyprenyl-6-methoxyphenol hydroxylase [Nocardioides exalbidus]|uniref:2-polyprenyl-6-methoxyphenol hydroxylase n=1 Tax=Nocardioides exalbidus TaxID=402596 RepID=A0A1H4QVJ2_9ACTN|nr:FAD-dependent monooxygenase [Nocardioides exalbidus]SEC23494.1 2-polyprenyl-6-methoxyphenol hydroxylase [Nocardioides exalbidus]
MTDRRAVILGASIAGLSAAYWLGSSGWDVTVIERAPSFRDGGQNVDVRGVAKDVLERMGLTEAVRAQNTTETGTVMVDDSGDVVAELPFGGEDGATAELEVLRGDLARAILDVLPDGVELVFDDRIEEVHDDEVVTAGGHRLAADLVVIAEGVRSRTRDLLFGDEVEKRPLGVTMVFGTIPRVPGDDDRWRWFTTTEGRQVHLRPDNRGTTRGILAFTDDDGLAGLDHAEAMSLLRERYADAGWEAPRLLDELATSDDVYVDDLTQVRVETWHRGNVVLTGDAAWCVTPMGGGGASLALTSGYVLASAFSQHRDDTAAAIAAYEGWMRPLVEDAQTMPRWVIPFAYPQSKVGVAARRVADKVLTAKIFEPVAAKITDIAETERELPPVPTA